MILRFQEILPFQVRLRARERWDTKETSVQEVAAILGVTYQFVYNKVRPLLTGEGINFVRGKSS